VDERNNQEITGEGEQHTVARNQTTVQITGVTSSDNKNTV